MGFTSNLEINHMLFILITLVASVVFSLVATRPGMRILTELCPKFFDRVDDFFMLGMEGLYSYNVEAGRDDEEELQFETELLLPLMYVSGGLALAIAWIAGLFGFSTFGCLVLSFLASLLPFAFGLAILVVGAVLIRFRSLFIDDVKNTGYISGSSTFDSSDSLSGNLADRAYDYVADKAEELQEFKKNPRSLVDFIDDLYDAARARLFNKRSKSTDLVNWKRDV